MLAGKKNQSPRPSGWTFNTSNGGGVSVGFFSGEGGSITLAEPKTGKLVKFFYGALGAGLSAGVKLPKLGKVNMPGVTGSSESFTSFGKVMMAGHFPKKELTIEDINGGCLFSEVNLGLAWGGAGYAMTFGMNTAELAMALLAPNGFGGSPYDVGTGILLFAGMNYGLQAGGGITGFAGVLSAA